MDKNSTLIIDGQVFQTDAWHRGMGKYSFSLVDALEKNGLRSRYDEVVILLNSNFETPPDALKALGKSVPQADIMYLDLKNPTPESNVMSLQAINAERLDGMISDQGFANVDYLILALFLDEACAVFPSVARAKLLLFYDLIPLLYHDRYQGRINYPNYLAHYKTIFEADKIFTISQTVADDNEIFLGINKDKLVNINGASIDLSKAESKKPKFKLKSKFILMPSGDELRKNNVRAVRGFEEFNQANGSEYNLVITSRFSEHTRENIKSLSDSVIFSGNIPVEELQWLYKNAELVLFASEYEGLGLPILEAMSVKKKIACSDIPVFKEISSDAFYYFDHLDPSSIAETLSSAISGNGWSEMQRQYKSILKKYTWKNSAQDFMSGITLKHEGKVKNSNARKPKVAVLTPHPAGYSAIGKVVAETHDSFREFFEVDYYFDSGLFHREVRPDFLSSIASCYDATEFNAAKYREYDAVIYHIGNSDYHLESIKNALYLPGYVILHDTFLDGAFESLKNAGYISNERLLLEEKLNEGADESTSRYLSSILNNQLGVVTHSLYAKDASNQVLDKKVPVQPINLPVSVSSRTNTKAKDSQFQIGLAGILADVKGLSIIEEIASSEYFKDCIINIFGFSFAKPEIIEQFQQWPHIKIHPNPTDFEFQTKLSKLDVLINYRLEYRGETSLTALEAMRYGVAVIVRGDIGWYAEIPDWAVAKAMSPEDVINKLNALYVDRPYSMSIANAARELVGLGFTHREYASQIYGLVMSSNSVENESNHNRSKMIKEYSKLRDIKHQLDII